MKKKYKVIIKVEYITIMNHEQTSKIKAKQDIENIIIEYLKYGKDIRNIFDKPPLLKFKVEKIC